MSNTRIYDDTAGQFSYGGNWFRQGTWTASNGQSGTLASTNEIGATVTFTFPVAATGFRFYGMKRSRGGSYGICVDCNPNSPSFVFVNGFDASDNGQNPPTALYSRSWGSAGVHTIIIRNQQDSRGTPQGNSQLTLDRFELDVPIPPANTVTVAPKTTVVQTVVTQVQQTTVVTGGNGGGNAGNGSPASQPAGGLTTVVQVVTTNVPANGAPSSPSSTGSPSTPSSPSSSTAKGSISNPSLQSQTDASTPPPSGSPSDTLGAAVNPTNTPLSDVAQPSSKSTPLGGIIGGVVGGLAVIAILILLFFWLKKRKQRSSSATGATPIAAPEMRATSPDATSGTGTSTSPRGGWVTGYGFVNEKANRHRPEQSFSSNPSDNVASSTNPATSNTALLSSSPVPPPASTSSYSQANSHSRSLSNENSDISETRRRELDAGPVPRTFRYDDDTETLPPEYGQLFADRMSGRASQFSRPLPRSPPPPLPTPLDHESPPQTGGFSSTGATATSLTTAATTSFNLSPNRSSQPFQPVRRT